MSIGAKPIVQPIIETNEPSLGLTNRPILESLRKATIPTLGPKPLVKPLRDPPKLGRPQRQLGVARDKSSYDILKDLEVVQPNISMRQLLVMAP
jgi:hypothetical protein